MPSTPIAAPCVAADTSQPVDLRRLDGRANETELRAPVSLVPLFFGVPLTCPATSRRRSCCPPKIHISTSRLCSPGSECLPFPKVIAHIRLSDSLGCVECELRFPSSASTCIPLSVCGTARASQMTDLSSLVRAWSNVPPVAPPARHCFAQAALLPSGEMTPWAPGKWTFRDRILTAHTFTYLRIAVVIAHIVARLATDLRVFALIGWDSHPLDRYSEFPDVSDHILPFGPAFPGHFHFTSFAKNAAARFKKSRSAVTRASSRRNRASSS